MYWNDQYLSEPKWNQPDDIQDEPEAKCDECHYIYLLSLLREGLCPDCYAEMAKDFDEED